MTRHEGPVEEGRLPFDTSSIAERRECRACGTSFVVSENKAAWFRARATERGWEGDPLPRRCDRCRKAGIRPGRHVFRTTAKR
jgi:hypothetical protein